MQEVFPAHNYNLGIWSLREWMTLLSVEVLRLLQAGCIQRGIKMENRDNNVCEWEWMAVILSYVRVLTKSEISILGYTSDVSETLDGLFCCLAPTPSHSLTRLTLGSGQRAKPPHANTWRWCCLWRLLHAPKLAAVKPTGMFPGAGVSQYMHTYMQLHYVHIHTVHTKCVCLHPY